MIRQKEFEPVSRDKLLNLERADAFQPREQGALKGFAAKLVALQPDDFERGQHLVTRRVTTFNGALEQNPPEIYLLDSGGWFLGPSGQGGIIRFYPDGEANGD